MLRVRTRARPAPGTEQVLSIRQGRTLSLTPPGSSPDAKGERQPRLLTAEAGGEKDAQRDKAGRASHQEILSRKPSAHS